MRLLEGIDYLREGSARQREAYRALSELRLMERLAPYGPVLAGTIPLGIDLPGSDLDIICEVQDPEGFAALLAREFPGCEVKRKEVGGLPTVIGRFEHGGFPIEVFGQPRPAMAQNAVRHMVAEARLLALAGPGAAEAIRRLKAQGVKTEPAFAAYFGIDGDPYAALLELAEASEERLRAIARGARRESGGDAGAFTDSQ